METMVPAQSEASTGGEWNLRWQEIEERMRNLRSKEISVFQAIDSHSRVHDLRKETKDRTLLIKIHLQEYSISWEQLDRVFARFGTIEYMEILCQDSAVKAVESFNHRYIFDGCCRMELFLDARFDDMDSKIETTNQKTLEEIRMDDQGTQILGFASVDESQDGQAETNANQEIDASLNSEMDSIKENNESFEDGEFIESPDIQSKSWEVIFKCLKPMVFDATAKKSDALSDLSNASLEIESLESGWASLMMNSACDLRAISAHKVFVEMPKNGDELVVLTPDIVSYSCAVAFDPRGGSSRQGLSRMVNNCWGESLSVVDVLVDSHRAMVGHQIFDPGIECLGMKLRVPNPLISTLVVSFQCLEATKQVYLQWPFERGRVLLSPSIVGLQI